MVNAEGETKKKLQQIVGIHVKLFWISFPCDMSVGIWLRFDVTHIHRENGPDNAH